MVDEQFADGAAIAALQQAGVQEPCETGSQTGHDIGVRNMPYRQRVVDRHEDNRYVHQSGGEAAQPMASESAAALHNIETGVHP